MGARVPGGAQQVKAALDSLCNDGTPFSLADALCAAELYAKLGYSTRHVFMEDMPALSLSRRGVLASFADLLAPMLAKFRCLPPDPPERPHIGHCLVILRDRTHGAPLVPVVVPEQFVADWEADRLTVVQNPMVQCVCDTAPSVRCPVECGARGPVVCREQQEELDDAGRREDDRRSECSLQSGADTVVNRHLDDQRMIMWSLHATYVDGLPGQGVVYNGPLISAEHVEAVYDELRGAGAVSATLATSVCQHIQAEIKAHLDRLRDYPFGAGTKRTVPAAGDMSPPPAKSFRTDSSPAVDPRPANGAFGAAVPVAQPVPGGQHVPTATFPAAMSPAAFSEGYDAWLANAKVLIKDESERYLIRVEAEPDSSGLAGGKIFLNNWMHHNRASAAKNSEEALPGAFVLLCLIAFVLDTILCNRGDVHIGPVPSQRGAASPARVAPARSAGRPADLGALQDAIAALDPVAQTDSKTRTLFPVGLEQWKSVGLKPLDDVKAIVDTCGFGVKKAGAKTDAHFAGRASTLESINTAADVHPVLAETIFLACRGRITVASNQVATPGQLMTAARISAFEKKRTGEDPMAPLLMILHRFVRELKNMTTYQLNDDVWEYVKEHAVSVFSFVCNPARDVENSDGRVKTLNLPRPYVQKYAVYRPPPVCKRHQRLPNGLLPVGSDERARFVGLHQA
jgi:hypothetical protein